MDCFKTGDIVHDISTGRNVFIVSKHEGRNATYYTCLDEELGFRNLILRNSMWLQSKKEGEDEL